MPILQTIDYQKVTLSEVELQREKVVADKLKALLPEIEVHTNVGLEQLTILEKALISFQTLAEKTRSFYQREFDEQHLIYKVSIKSNGFHLKESDVNKLFTSFLSNEEIEISPTTDEQGNPCVSISKHFQL